MRHCFQLLRRSPVYGSTEQQKCLFYPLRTDRSPRTRPSTADVCGAWPSQPWRTFDAGRRGTGTHSAREPGNIPYSRISDRRSRLETEAGIIPPGRFLPCWSGCEILQTWCSLLVPYQWPPAFSEIIVAFLISHISDFYIYFSFSCLKPISTLCNIRLKCPSLLALICSNKTKWLHPDKATAHKTQESYFSEKSRR